MNRLRSTAIGIAFLFAACNSNVTPTTQPSQQTPTSPPATSSPTATAAPSPTATAPVAAEPVAADLDGVITSPDLAHRIPVLVSIDDSRAARPQAGFNGASIVWQAPADGYESRYLLVFQESDASTIGPVRSARNYSAHWTAELRGALAHYGGDLLTRRWMAENRGVLFTDVDGMGAGNPAFHRIQSRVAPHNAYTSTEDLRRVAARLGAAETYDTTLHVRPFRDDSAATDRGSSQRVTVPYNTVTISYAYDTATNAYLRYIDGRPHVDPMDNRQVTARTVVVLFMKFRTDSTIEKGHNRPVLGYIGSGTGRVYMEGRAFAITWSKASVTGPTLILGADGKELSLIRGRIFIQVVPIGTNVVAKS